MPAAEQNPGGDVPEPPITLTGLILVGGRGTRLGGVDKSTALRDSLGRPLGLRQRELFEQLGVGALLWAVREGQTLPPAWLEPLAGGRAVAMVIDAPIPDRTGTSSEGEATSRPGAGPLAALAAGLAAANTSHVAALAVDMPDLPLAWWHKLLAATTAGRGAVGRGTHGWEPLAAIYPVSLATAASAALARGALALQLWVQTAVDAGTLARVDIASDEAGWFRNINTAAEAAVNIQHRTSNSELPTPRRPLA